ncbi:MAG: B12-binding domain-containing radical SAM protein [Peptostreptococcaceae bacterium]|jgi:radical SAM superfamily enzyme YgiQ (UPF0313 family)|nr:B12-binding domain-containing radical SAM protein [Peptostreptococcaceae bacterium]
MKALITTLNSKYVHTNLAIRYLKAQVEDIIDIELKEFTINTNLNYILNKIYEQKSDLIIFSTYIWNLEETLKISRSLKKIKKDIKILLGGPEVSFEEKELLLENDCIDYIIRGEGEFTFKEFIRAYSNDEPLSEIKGLTYRLNDKIIKNEDREFIKDLDLIKSPYSNINKDEYKNKIIYYETSRGCPFNCEYCLSSTLDGIRFFSLNRVKSDIKNLINSGVKQIKFIDRTFNIEKNRVLELLDFLIEKDDGNINYHLEIAAHVLSKEIIDKLKYARKGLFQFEIGVQSTNEKTLREIGRYQDFNKLKENVLKIKSYENIHQHLDLIAGLPYENYESFKKSFNDVFNLDVGHVQLGFLKVLKGTKIKAKEEIHGFLYRDYPTYEILQTKYIKYEELEKLKEVEEIVEIYWNSKNFNTSLRFIINNLYENNPFLFFDEFSLYFKNKDYFDISLGINKLYEILLDYFESDLLNRFDKKIDYIDLFKDLLKFDYMTLGKKNKIPKIFNKIDIADYKDLCHKFLKEISNLEKYLKDKVNVPAKFIIKDVSFETFSYDILSLKESNYKDIKKDQNDILFIYDLKEDIIEKARFYKVELNY